MAQRYPMRGDGVPRWVVRMVWRGRALAWSSDGAAVAGLDALLVGPVELDAMSDTLDLNGSDIRETVSLSLPWLEDAQPKDLQDRYVEVALVPASGWTNRYTMATGRVTRTLLDRPGALVGIEISPEDFTDRVYPPATWTVSDRTHPLTDNEYVLSLFPQWMSPTDISTYVSITDGPREEAYGAGYPVLYGYSESTQHPAITSVPMAPAPVIDDSGTDPNKVADKILVAAGTLATDDLVVWGLAEDDLLYRIEVDSADIIYGVDYLGQSYTAVDVHTENSSARKGDWYVSTTANAAPTATAGVGHITEWLLSQVGAVDVAYCGEATARTASLPIGGYIDEPVRPLAWVQERVSGTYPIAMSRAPTGRLRLAYVPYTGGAPVAELVDGSGGVYRSGDVKEMGNRGTTQVEIRYRYSVARERYLSTLTLSDGPRENTLQSDTLELDDAYTDATAGIAAQYYLWRQRYRREISLDASVEDYGWLRPGHIVRYSDADLGISSALYIVLSIERTDRPFTAIRLTPIAADAR